MSERSLPMADAQYRPLKSFAAKRGGYRMAIHGAMRDRVVEMIVEETFDQTPGPSAGAVIDRTAR